MADELASLALMKEVMAVTRAALPDAVEKEELEWQRQKFKWLCGQNYALMEAGPVSDAEKELLRASDRTARYIEKNEKMLKGLGIYERA